MSMRLLVMALSLACGVCAHAAENQKAESTPTATAKKSGADFHETVEKETFLLVNDYRKKNGFPALKWSDNIAKIARAHSKDMATGAVDFGHSGFRERIDQLKEKMDGFRGAGENVLMTSDLSDVAKSALALWLRSPRHLANIRGDYNSSGLGVWQNKDGTLYFTQIFVKVESPLEEAKAY